MKKYKKSLFAFAGALIILLAYASTAFAAALPSPTYEFFVNDYCNILTAADKNEIFEMGRELEEKTKAQVVLVTVRNTGDTALEDYSLQLAREWGIGDKELNNGVLLLFTADGPHSRIEVGYGLEGAIPDSKAGRILDNRLVPSYDEKDEWSGALKATYADIVNEVYAEYGDGETAYPEEEASPLETFFGAAILIGIILLIIFGRRFLGPFISFSGGSGGGYSSGGGFSSGGGGGFSGGVGGFGGGGASR
jgi:uncharacterized protein